MIGFTIGAQLLDPVFFLDQWSKQLPPSFKNRERLASGERLAPFSMWKSWPIRSSAVGKFFRPERYNQPFKGLYILPIRFAF